MRVAVIVEGLTWLQIYIFLISLCGCLKRGNLCGKNLLRLLAKMDGWREL